MERLSPAEEEAIRYWILDLSRWGWPIWIERLRTMAKELLLDKGDTADLGVHWTDQFLNQHPDCCGLGIASTAWQLTYGLACGLEHNIRALARITVKIALTPNHVCYGLR